MPFWTTDHSADPALNDPKRKFRFKVAFGNIGSDAGVLWYAKTATKPSFQIAAAEHKYLNHTFYYPGSVTWQDVTVTLVDPVDPDMAATMTDIVATGGYTIPAGYANMETISKAKAATALGAVTVSQIDSAGNELETWTMHNCFITEVKYGDLEYGGDDLTEISLTMKYDWASLTTNGKSDLNGSSANTFFNVSTSSP